MWVTDCPAFLNELQPLVERGVRLHKWKWCVAQLKPYGFAFDLREEFPVLLRVKVRLQLIRYI